MQRRSLRLATLESIEQEIDRLHLNGYQQAGNWNLSQTCEHLADWMSFPIDGFPKVPWVIGLLLGVMRRVSGKKLLKKVIEDQSMKIGQPTIQSTVHAKGGNEQASVDRFKSALHRLIQHRGSIHSSPLFGAMNREELISLQLAHCNHHLSFLASKEPT